MAKSLSKKQFYLLSLWLPVALPLLAGLVCFIPGLRFIGWWFALLCGFALAFGGVQYVVFIAVAFTYWLKDKTGDELQRLSWRLPLYYLPFAAVGYGIYKIITEILGGAGVSKALEQAALDMFTLFVVMGIPFTYFYVLLAHGLYKLLTKCKLVTNP